MIFLILFDFQTPVYTILTREHAECISFIHDRMPVILGKDHVKEWMDQSNNPAEVVKKALTNMYYEKATQAVL